MMCLTEVFPYEPVIADHGRLELVEPGAGLVPVAALHPRLGRSEQQIGGDQGQRNELHRDDPDDDKLADQRRGDPDQRREDQRDRVNPLGARGHRQLLFRRLARIALDRRGPETGQPGQRDERRFRHQRQQDQLRREDREQDQRQPPVPAAVFADPAQKAPGVVLLLLKQVQIGQQPAGRENGEAEHGEQDGQGGHATCSTNSDRRCTIWWRPSVRTLQWSKPRRTISRDCGISRLSLIADLGRGLAVAVAIYQHRRAGDRARDLAQILADRLDQDRAHAARRGRNRRCRTARAAPRAADPPGSAAAPIRKARRRAAIRSALRQRPGPRQPGGGDQEKPVDQLRMARSELQSDAAAERVPDPDAALGRPGGEKFGDGVGVILGAPRSGRRRRVAEPRQIEQHRAARAAASPRPVAACCGACDPSHAPRPAAARPAANSPSGSNTAISAPRTRTVVFLTRSNPGRLCRAAGGL